MRARRLLVRLAALAVCAACVFGAAHAQPVEIVFWHPFQSGTPRQAIDHLVDTFNAMQDEIRVVSQVVPDLVAKVRVAAVGGAPPDVATNLYPWREGAVGLLTDLTPYALRDGLDLTEAFFPAGIPEAYYNGVLYGLPWFHVVHPVLYYRVDAYEEAGLDGNAPPATWEQLREISLKLTRRTAEGAVTQLGFDWGRGSAEYAFPMYYRVAGGEYLDPAGKQVLVNNDLGRRVLNWLVNVYEEIAPDLAAARGTFYDRGRVHMVNGNWTANDLRSSHPYLEPGRDWAMAPFPVPEGRPQQTLMSTRYLAIPAGAPHPDAAWEFIKWLTGPYAVREYALARGLLPAHREAVNDPAYAETFLFWDVQQMMLIQGVPEWGSVPIPDVVSFLALMEEALVRARSRTASPEAALEDAARRMQAYLDSFAAP